jgi:multimeric flavodoxin WrbA
MKKPKKITILNGDPRREGTPLKSMIASLEGSHPSEVELETFALAKMEIRQCIGCWSCWWKTPGECVLKDDTIPAMKAVIHSDLVVFASPLMAGFTSGLLKRLQDRLIVLVHPYIEPMQGECHHRKRYTNYPDLALLLEKEKDTDDEDIQIVTDIYRRLALNFHSQLKHIWFSDNQSTEEIQYDISHL